MISPAGTLEALAAGTVHRAALYKIIIKYTVLSGLRGSRQNSIHTLGFSPASLTATISGRRHPHS